METPGAYLNEMECLCVAPEQSNDGLVELVVKINRGSAILTGATKYRYSK